MDQPNFYSIIPATVRYHKKLKANEKLLYGEITSLANAKGYCYAGNGYFAELYNVKVETVSRWIANLEKYGFIRSVVKKEDGNKRDIYISEIMPNDDDLLTKESIPIDEKVNTPIDKKVKYNNTSINNKNNINKIFDFWNSKDIIKHQKLTDDLKNIIDSAIEKYGVENIISAINRYSQAYFDIKFYYNNRWALANFLKQKNGITNWLDDGQIWNNYCPVLQTPKGTSSPLAVPDSEQTDTYLENLRKLREGGGNCG